jgi:hypothetical protein
MNSSAEYREHWTVIACCTDWHACPPCGFVVNAGENQRATLDELFRAHNACVPGSAAMFDNESGFANGEIIFERYIKNVGSGRYGRFAVGDS